MNRTKHEGSFRKRPDGRWQAKIQLDGKRYCVYAKTRTEAMTKIEEIKSRYKSGIQPQPENHTIVTWTETWLNDYTKLRVRPNTFLQIKSIVDKHIIPTIGEMKLQKIDSSCIQRVMRQKLDEGLAPTMVKKIRNAIHAILEYAVKCGILIRNPADSVSIKGAKNKEIVALTAEQLRMVIKEAQKHPLYPAVLLLCTTGLRRSELIGLQWADINWNRGTIQVRRSVVKLGGYGYLITDTKTATSRRMVPIRDFVKTALWSHRKHQVSSGIQSEFVFARPDGRPLYPEVVLDYIKRVGKRIGIPNINVHMLRHTVATLLLESGENPKVVQELLGHSSIAVTMDIYSHVLPGMKEKAVEKLSALIADGVETGVKTV